MAARSQSALRIAEGSSGGCTIHVLLSLPLACYGASERCRPHPDCNRMESLQSMSQEGRKRKPDPPAMEGWLWEALESAGVPEVSHKVRQQASQGARSSHGLVLHGAWKVGGKSKGSGTKGR